MRSSPSVYAIWSLRDDEIMPVAERLRNRQAWHRVPMARSFARFSTFSGLRRRRPRYERATDTQVVRDGKIVPSRSRQDHTQGLSLQ